MNQPLRIEPVTLEAVPGIPCFDLVDQKTDEAIATIYGDPDDPDEASRAGRARFAALIFASALGMFELLRMIHQRPEATTLDQWWRDVGEIVRRAGITNGFWANSPPVRPIK